MQLTTYTAFLAVMLFALPIQADICCYYSSSGICPLGLADRTYDVDQYVPSGAPSTSIVTGPDLGICCCSRPHAALCATELVSYFYLNFNNRADGRTLKEMLSQCVG